MIKNLTAIATATALAAAGTIYPTTCIVTNCDTQNNIVTMSTGSGFTYQFEGVEDNYEGDLISCIMFNNFTPDDIRDDIILSHLYSGYTELFDGIIKVEY